MTKTQTRELQRIVVLGGGTAGTLVANRLRRALPNGTHIVVVDENNRHIYQPGLLFVPFGLMPPKRLVRPRARQFHKGIDYVQSAIDHVDIKTRNVHLANGTTYLYDALIVATGSRLLPDETEGLSAGSPNVFTFYDVEGAVRLRDALATFERGRLVVNIVDLPIKCPVAPLEFCFLADSFFQRRGVRDDIQIDFVTPLDGAFTKPVASEMLGDLLQHKGISLVTDFNTSAVKGEEHVLEAYDGRTVPFDLAVVIPVHGGADYIARSEGLGDAMNFVPVDTHTLQSHASEAVFAMGDAAALPASKAGSVAHFQGETVVVNVCAFLAGKPLSARYDGHANCFIETGHGEAMLIDFNYDTEPLPGHYPGAVGLPLLEESRLNHASKRAFEWLYWHSILPGRDVPGIRAEMPLRGKRRPDVKTTT